MSTQSLQVYGVKRVCFSTARKRGEALDLQEAGMRQRLDEVAAVEQPTRGKVQWGRLNFRTNRLKNNPLIISSISISSHSVNSTQNCSIFVEDKEYLILDRTPF